MLPGPPAASKDHQRPPRLHGQVAEDLGFRVVLDKTTGRNIGATLKVSDDIEEREFVEIAEVTGDLLQQWNEDHPELAVKQGDLVAEVNGTKAWWTQNRILELVVKRQVQVASVREELLEHKKTAWRRSRENSPDGSRSSRSPGAPTLCQEDQPGNYIVIQPTVVTETVDRDSRAVTDLEVGTRVHVLEIMKVPAQQRVRARLMHPAGWISLLSTEDGSRWAEQASAKERLKINDGGSDETDPGDAMEYAAKCRRWPCWVLPGVLLVVVVAVLTFTSEGHRSRNGLRAPHRALVDRLAPGPHADGDAQSASLPPAPGPAVASLPAGGLAVGGDQSALDYELSIDEDCFAALPEPSRDTLQAVVTDVLREALPDARTTELRQPGSDSPHSAAERRILVWDSARYTNSSGSALQAAAPTKSELIDIVSIEAESRIAFFTELCPGPQVFKLLPIKPVVDDAEDVVEVVDGAQDHTAMVDRSNDAPGAPADGSLGTDAGGSGGSPWLVWLLLPIGVVVFGAALVMMCRGGFVIGAKMRDIRWCDIRSSATSSAAKYSTVGSDKADPMVEQHQVNLKVNEDRSTTTKVNEVNLIVVPGGGLSSGQPPPWVEERLLEARAVYDSARVSGKPDHGMPRIITHNSSSSEHVSHGLSGNTGEADICSKYLVENCGVPRNDVIVDNSSFTLIGNAYFARLHADAKRMRHVVVVTNRFHMNRAMAVFSAVFALKPLPKGRDDWYMLYFREAPDRGLDSEDLAALHEQESHALRKFVELMRRFTCLDDVRDFLLGQQGRLRDMADCNDSRGSSGKRAPTDLRGAREFPDGAPGRTATGTTGASGTTRGTPIN